jgi:HD-GYP domain-containing protein (c-di-GMP phosphodiesterase class II)
MSDQFLFSSYGNKLYQDLLLFTQKSTEAIGKGERISLSLYLDVTSYIIEDFHRSNELLESALRFYDPKDLCKSHAVNVAIFSLKMAHDMDLSKEDIEDTLLAGLFHDVGFGRILKLLHCKDENTIFGHDLELVRKHPEYGYQGILSNSNREKRIAEIILQHHEKADGTGYPNRLKESEQWLQARIISIIDDYEVLIHPRPFRDALLPPKGIEAILQKKGTAFSATMIKALINSLSLYPVGSFVMVNNGFIGKVIKTYTDNPLDPDLEIHFDSSGKKLQEKRILKLKEHPLLRVDKCLPGFFSEIKFN